MKSSQKSTNNLDSELFSSIDELITKTANTISKTIDYEKHLSEILGEAEIVKNKKKCEIEKLLAYLILESLWIHQIILKDLESEKGKIQKNKKEIVKSLELFTSKYGFNIFPIKLISDLPNDLLLEIISIFNKIEENHFAQKDIDVRGLIFQNLLPEELRKLTGSYHTRFDAADLLAPLTITSPEQTVMDLSCGSGKLLVASYRHLKSLQQKKNKKSLGKTIQQIVGFDIMPLPARLSIINLFLENPELSSTIKIGIANSLFLKPTDSFKPLKTFATSKNLKIGKSDVVIMNPPFTRQESLSKKEKNELVQRFENYNIDKRFGLHAYFILLANEFLKENGRLGLVLPATVLRINSLSNLRKFLVRNYQIEYILVSNQTSSFSHGSRFREILLVAKKSLKPKKDHVRIAILNEKPESGKNLKKIIQNLTSKESKDSDGIKIIDIDYEFFEKNSENLFRFISLSDEKVLDLYTKLFLKNNSKFVKISDYVESRDGVLIRGWETLRSEHPIQSDFVLLNKGDANDKTPWYFVNQENGNITTRNIRTNSLLKIPKKAIKLGLRRLGNINTINANGKLDFIIQKKFSGIENFLSKSQIENFPEWERIIQKKSANLAFVRRFNIAGPRMKIAAIVSDEEFTPTQTMSIMTKIPLDEAKIQSLWINSTFHILQMIIERVETEGSFMELPEWAMKNLLVLNIDVLSKSQKKMLLDAYVKYSNIEFPSLLEQLKSEFKARKEIDKLILEILGIKISIPELHAIVLAELKNLKLLVSAND